MFGSNFNAQPQAIQQPVMQPTQPWYMPTPQQSYWDRLNALQQQIAPQPQQQVAQPQSNVSWVQVAGVDGIKNTTVQPNTTVWAMDSNDTVFYVKSADNMGVCTTKAYRFAEIPLETVGAPTPEYASKADMDALAARINALESKGVKHESPAQSYAKPNTATTAVATTESNRGV